MTVTLKTPAPAGFPAARQANERPANRSAGPDGPRLLAVDVPAALNHLRDVFTVAELAGELAVHTSTVYRWRAGTRRPNPTNLAALRRELELKLDMFSARPRLTVEAVHLQNALDCLRTGPNPGLLAELTSRVEAVTAEGQQQRRAAQPAARRPYRSITRAADPWALLGQPEPAPPF